MQFVPDHSVIKSNFSPLTQLADPMRQNAVGSNCARLPQSNYDLLATTRLHPNFVIEQICYL